MKRRVLGLGIVSLVIVSCASRKSTQVAKFEEVKSIVVLNENQLHGKSVYEEKCVRCHKLYEPSSYSAEAWKPIVARMQKKAKISDEDAASVYNYLTASL